MIRAEILDWVGFVGWNPIHYFRNRWSIYSHTYLLEITLPLVVDFFVNFIDLNLPLCLLHYCFVVVDSIIHHCFTLDHYPMILFLPVDFFILLFLHWATISSYFHFKFVNPRCSVLILVDLIFMSRIILTPLDFFHFNFLYLFLLKHPIFAQLRFMVNFNLIFDFPFIIQDFPIFVEGSNF